MLSCLRVLRSQNHGIFFFSSNSCDLTVVKQPSTVGIITSPTCSVPTLCGNDQRQSLMNKLEMKRVMLRFDVHVLVL